MNDLSPTLSRYDKLTDDEKAIIIDEAYNTQSMSWTEIAKLANTYPNKILRDAKRLGVKSRDRSDAQRLALQSGRHKHPTKDVGHSEASKAKIGDSLHTSWESRGESAKKAHADAARERWNARPQEEIDKTRRAAFDAIRRAASEGSQLEQFLEDGLKENGFRVDKHKEQWVSRDRLQIDLFIPEINTAVEVDGPSHFRDIWGSDTLEKNKKRDIEKTGMLLRLGCCIVRVKQSKGLTKKFKRDSLNRLVEILNSIKKAYPPEGQRQFTIGD